MRNKKIVLFLVAVTCLCLFVWPNSTVEANDSAVYTSEFGIEFSGYEPENDLGLGENPLVPDSNAQLPNTGSQTSHLASVGWLILLLLFFKFRKRIKEKLFF